MLDKEIYSYLNTLDNLKALLKAKQRGISTDGQKNWCYKDGSNQLHVGADQKYWNGSAWVYARNEFGATTFYGNLYINNLPAKSDPATTVLVPGPDGCVSTRTVTQIRSDIGAVSTNDPRLSDARVPINNDYYVQGSNSSRTTDAGSADVNAYSQSGFYGAASTAPHLPTTTDYGIIYTNHPTNNSKAFQLASRWDANKLYYRTCDGSWQPWVELYHSGNLNPADYVTLSTAQTITGQKTFSADTTINGTLKMGGNLALGANTISRDGSANKGIGVEATGLSTVTATAATSGDTRTVLRLYDDTAWGAGDGAGINLYGKTKDSGSYANFGGIKVSKENGVSGDNAASFYIQSKKHGSNPTNALRLDSSQNGYIKNKLMVGSLTETPENQLVVYNSGAVDTFIQVINSVTGSGSGDGLIIGVDADGDAVLRVDYGRYLKFQCETSSGIKEMATLRYTGTTRFNVNGDIQCDNFRLDQDPIAGAITPDKYIIINCNGTNYKIPVVAA